ncbi:hypothetical protein ACFLR7_05845 [Acidobacteriota bacterium]
MGTVFAITVVSGLLVLILWTVLVKPLITRLSRKRPHDDVPKIKTSVHEDLKILEGMKRPLKTINQITSHYVNNYKEVARKELNTIHDEATKLKSKRFDDIKQKLIDFSNKEEKVHQTISLGEVKNLLIQAKDGTLLALGLYDEIEGIVIDEIQKKEKK